MKIFDNEKLGYYAVENDSQLPDFCPTFSFKALIIIDHKIAKEVQFAWANWLVEKPCRYMLAWGFECLKWDDIVDDTVVMKKIELENQKVTSWQNILLEDYHIVTMWYEQDTIDKVIEYCLRADEFDEQKTEWIWIIDFYNRHNRLPVLEKFLDKLAK